MTKILIVIPVVSKVGRSFKTPCDVVLWRSIWHCTPLGQVIKSYDFWLRVIEHQLNRRFGLRHFIVAT
jgi:hypothetical protein